VLNRKFADLRHAPDLDPVVLRYEPAALPQAVVAIGPHGRRKVKDGLVLADPGFAWALFLFPGRWYAITSVHDLNGLLVGHHVDLCLPPEERDGVLSFLDLKLDLLVRPDGTTSWLDQEDYEQEIASGTIPLAWQRAVSDTVAALDRACAGGTFPPDEVRRYRPATSPAH
jgi:predicted RNA-binding protein associated with RNAse of E/G family